MTFLARQESTKSRKLSDQSPTARDGESFCAMWYKALIAFMLNSGGRLSAVKPHNTHHMMMIICGSNQRRCQWHCSDVHIITDNVIRDMQYAALLPIFLSVKSGFIISCFWFKPINIIVITTIVLWRWFPNDNRQKMSHWPSSMHVIPRDQTSTLPSYCPSSIASITSGAIQYGVPTKELAGLTADAEPKSATNTTYRTWSICRTLSLLQYARVSIKSAWLKILQ